MNPQDMARRLLNEGDLVHVTSKRGSIIVPLQASVEVGMSQAFMAMHWGEEYLSGCSSTGLPLAGVNALTTSAYCPSSKQPELKHAAVKILKAELPWSLLGVAWLDASKIIAARACLAGLMSRFPYASCVPFADNTPLTDAEHQRSGVLFRAAAHEAPPDELLAEIERHLGLIGNDTMRYQDRKKGQRRVMRMARHPAAPNAAATGIKESIQLDAFLLAGDTSAEAWIKTLLQDELPAEAYGRLLLAPGAKAPLAVHSRGRQICSCFYVTDMAISAQLEQCTGDDAARLEQLQTALKCGTNCGSCLPELKRLLVAAKSTEKITA
jgi:assimilatory nitrate reductase catalytic subunit